MGYKEDQEEARRAGSSGESYWSGNHDHRRTYQQQKDLYYYRESVKKRADNYLNSSQKGLFENDYSSGSSGDAELPAIVKLLCFAFIVLVIFFFVS